MNGQAVTPRPTHNFITVMNRVSGPSNTLFAKNAKQMTITAEFDIERLEYCLERAAYARLDPIYIIHRRRDRHAVAGSLRSHDCAGDGAVRFGHYSMGSVRSGESG